MTRTDQDHRI